MTPQEYEAAFHGIFLPQKLDLFPGSHIPDLRKFLDAELHIMKATTSTMIRDAVSYRLDTALRLIQNQ
ncbi:MAG TPA: hypothetical protein VKB19_03750 [Pedobacter sp.]|nr:hypothetical protein [Pedobacter sp.]